MVEFSSVAEALAQKGAALGPSHWIEIDQKRINLFAEATGDFQWIHVDEKRAAEGPFGKTIAHGYLTFSLINLVLPDLVKGVGFRFGLNYGANRLRFPAPVPVGSRIRVAGVLAEVEDIGNNGVQTTARLAVEVEGQDKPGCVADVMSRFYF